MGARRTKLLFLAMVMGVVSTLAACGPTLYTFNSIGASGAVGEAEQSNAAEHAPYEYFYARAYLDKAREEAAEANYQDAWRFAERAAEFGTKARDLARRRMREQGR
jgi:hypothetical protein